MNWTTRAGIHVDRAASAWLIKRYVDPDAQFTYVDDIAEVPADSTPFDMVGCELTHKGSDVTFETILRVHEILDPVLWQIARIVHQADVEDDLYDAPEAVGFDAIVRALGCDHTDEEVREITATILDSLYLHLRSEELGRHA